MVQCLQLEVCRYLTLCASLCVYVYLCVLFVCALMPIRIKRIGIYLLLFANVVTCFYSLVGRILFIRNLISNALHLQQIGIRLLNV